MSTPSYRPRGAGAGRLQTALSAGYDAQVSRGGSPEPGWGEIFQIDAYDEKVLMLQGLLTMTFFVPGILGKADAPHLRAKMYYDDNTVLKFSLSKAVGSIDPRVEPTKTFCTRTFTCNDTDSLVCIADSVISPDECGGPPLSAATAQPFFTRALAVWEEHRHYSKY